MGFCTFFGSISVHVGVARPFLFIIFILFVRSFVLDAACDNNKCHLRANERTSKGDIGISMLMATTPYPPNPAILYISYCEQTIDKCTTSHHRYYKYYYSLCSILLVICSRSLRMRAMGMLCKYRWFAFIIIIFSPCII